MPVTFWRFVLHGEDEGGLRWSGGGAPVAVRQLPVKRMPFLGEKPQAKRTNRRSRRAWTRSARLKSSN